MLILFILLWVIVYFTKVYFTMVYDLFFLSFTLLGERIYLICHNWSPFNIRSRSRNGWNKEGMRAWSIYPIREEDGRGITEAR